MQVDATTWTVGFVIAAVIVVVVVAVVLAINVTAARVRDRVQDIVAALEDARSHTAALWQLETTDNVSRDVLELSQDVGELLER